MPHFSIRVLHSVLPKYDNVVHISRTAVSSPAYVALVKREKHEACFSQILPMHLLHRDFVNQVAGLLQNHQISVLQFFGPTSTPSG